MTKCIKLFRRINGNLCSLYNVYPLIYQENEWTHAPEGTKLFVYDLKDSLNEYCSIIEAWYCECSIMQMFRGDFIDISHYGFLNRYILDTCENVEKLQDFWKNYTKTDSISLSTCCVDSVKPLRKIEVISKDRLGFFGNLENVNV